MRCPLALAAVLLWSATSAAAAATPRWHWPLRGELTGRFRVMPASPYAAGQRRGIDIAAPPPAPPAIPSLAWVGVGLLAAGLPLGALTRRTKRRRRASATRAGRPSPSTSRM